MQKKKSGVKKCLEILPLRGGGGGRLMANAILNFHFDYLNPSLNYDADHYDDDHYDGDHYDDERECFPHSIKRLLTTHRAHHVCINTIPQRIQ